jgi:sugar O-acyltransferase (sialic acid O-acetyltransferase NeuD family)
MDKIIIWGAMGQAIVLEELLSSTSINIEAFFENDTKVNSPIPGVPIYYKEEGFIQWLSAIENRSEYYYLVAIGGNNGNVRCKIGEMLKEAGLRAYTAIHRTAFVSHNAIIGEGTQILANSNVCARVVLGKYCIINTAASVDHECIVGDNVHIGPGAKLAGCVQVEDNVFVGTNATILPGIKIGKNASVGAGAVVTRLVPAYSVVVGNPAKVIKILDSFD